MKMFWSMFLVLFLGITTCRADKLELLFIGPLSGDVAPLGLSAVKGLELYQREFPDSDVVLRVEDDQFRPL